MRVCNPFLPLNVYMADCEPHVYNDRVYVFGSHDREGGKSFCELGYEFYSAPINDLSSWSSKGINYEITDDPEATKEGYDRLYAPDVCQGRDGRFYLIYCPAGGKHFTGPLSIAVCDTPDGKYKYLGRIKDKNGRVFTKKITFDPGIINDNGHIRVYFGWSLSLSEEHLPKLKEKESFRQIMKMVFNKTDEQLDEEDDDIMNAYEIELGDDMLTIIDGPHMIVPGQIGSSDPNNEFNGHGFFEASSIRKINNKYYFIYSSLNQHELCYATSDYPDKDFHYGGTIISNGDIGLNGRREEDRLNTTGNNHGSIVKINDQWYTTYHRHTQNFIYSRQSGFEKIKIEEDGSIKQVELTSCGLNNGPLKPEGSYSAFYACNITNGHMPHIGLKKIEDPNPHFDVENDDHFIKDMTNGCEITYKYFDFNGNYCLSIETRGKGNGKIEIYTDGKKQGEMSIYSCSSWNINNITIKENKVSSLTLKYIGEDTIDIMSISFAKEY